jgi:hypothetical protein
MNRMNKERRERMQPTTPGNCRRRRSHAPHVATWRDRRTLCDGQPPIREPSLAWYVIWKKLTADRPALVGPFTSEADAQAYVTFREDDGLLCWVVQNEAVDYAS